MAVAAERAGATVVSQVRYHFGHNSPPGFTAVVLLDESHCTAHTYADLGLIALDVFTCGSTEPRDVLAYLREEVDLGEVTIREVGRFPLEPGMEGHGAVLAAVANELAVAAPGDGPRLA